MIVASGLPQGLMNFIFWLHFIRPVYVIETFEPLRAAGLVLLTSIIGYVIGSVFALLWNRVHRGRPIVSTPNASRLLATVLVILLSGTADAAGADARHGQQYAERWCSQCHGVQPRQVSSGREGAKFLRYRSESLDDPPFADCLSANDAALDDAEDQTQTGGYQRCGGLHPVAEEPVLRSPLSQPDERDKHTMIKSILVPATGTEADLTSLTTALKIAHDFSAHIDALHVRFDAVDIAVKTASGEGGPLVEHLIQQLEQDAREREARARQAFEDFCRRENLPLVGAPGNEPTTGPSAQWHVETGDEAGTVASQGLLADLIVCARSPDAHFTTRLILESALLNTGRPLLIPSAVGKPADFAGGTWQSRGSRHRRQLAQLQRRCRC